MTQDTGDVFAVDDFYTLNQMRQMQRAQLKLAELKERSEEIARITGKAPVGYFAYERANPTPLQYEKNGVGKGIIAGMAFGGLTGYTANLLHRTRQSTTNYVVAGIGIGAAVGGIAGAFTKETEESRRIRSLAKYEFYIGSLESVMAQSDALSHADTIRAARLQPAQKSLA